MNSTLDRSAGSPLRLSSWQQRIHDVLAQKEVLILHGNVRDIGYVRPNGELFDGLTHLIREIGRAQGFQRVIFWGVFRDREGHAQRPMLWATERIEYLTDARPSEIRTTEAQDRQVVVLTRWLMTDAVSTAQSTLLVIYYIDKLTPYSEGGNSDPLSTLVQKLIENIASCNRLLMVALQDTMVPRDYYIQSPKTAVLEIPLPTKEERLAYLATRLSNMPQERLELIASVTEGLYVRDLQNIHETIVKEPPESLSSTRLRQIVNRYRLGSEQDPWSALPLVGERGLLDQATQWFRSRVIGQDHAIEEIVKAIRKARAGVSGLAAGAESKPKAIFFFAGPTGTGKTYLAKKLAEYLFGNDRAFVRLDMSEYMEEHSVAKLIGSPPGYVGYDRGGQLTNAVRERPFTVLLIDEIEKAHPRVLDMFLQILDDGRLTDSRGQTVFFTESVIVFTSNIGTRSTDGRGRDIGALERERLQAILHDSSAEPAARAGRLRQHFVKAVERFFREEISRPELLNRIGSHIVAFNYIDAAEDAAKLTGTKIAELRDAFNEKFAAQGFSLRFDPDVVGYYHERYRGILGEFGGRGLINSIDDEITAELASAVLAAERDNCRRVTFHFHLENGKPCCNYEASASR